MRREDENFEFKTAPEPRIALVWHPRATGSTETHATIARPISAGNRSPSRRRFMFQKRFLATGRATSIDKYSEFVSACSSSDKQAVSDAVTDAITSARERGELSPAEVETISEGMEWRNGAGWIMSEAAPPIMFRWLGDRIRAFKQACGDGGRQVFRHWRKLSSGRASSTIKRIAPTFLRHGPRCLGQSAGRVDKASPVAGALTEICSNQSRFLRYRQHRL